MNAQTPSTWHILLKQSLNKTAEVSSGLSELSSAVGNETARDACVWNEGDIELLYTPIFQITASVDACISYDLHPKINVEMILQKKLLHQT